MSHLHITTFFSNSQVRLLRNSIIRHIVQIEVIELSNLYNVILKLCESQGISGYRLCKDIGIQPSLLTDLKMGRQKSLNASNATKIANYFGVSVDYLLGHEDQREKPVPSGEDELDGMSDKKRELWNELKDASDIEIDAILNLLKIDNSKK